MLKLLLGRALLFFQQHSLSKAWFRWRVRHRLGLLFGKQTRHLEHKARELRFAWKAKLYNFITGCLMMLETLTAAGFALTQIVNLFSFLQVISLSMCLHRFLIDHT